MCKLAILCVSAVTTTVNILSLATVLSCCEATLISHKRTNLEHRGGHIACRHMAPYFFNSPLFLLLFSLQVSSFFSFPIMYFSASIMTPDLAVWTASGRAHPDDDTKHKKGR